MQGRHAAKGWPFKLPITPAQWTGSPFRHNLTHGTMCGPNTVNDPQQGLHGKDSQGAAWGAPGCAAPPYDAGPAPPGYGGLGPAPTPGP